MPTYSDAYINSLTATITRLQSELAETRGRARAIEGLPGQAASEIHEMIFALCPGVSPSELEKNPTVLGALFACAVMFRIRAQKLHPDETPENDEDFKKITAQFKAAVASALNDQDQRQ